MEQLETRRMRRIRPTAASKARSSRLMDHDILDGYLRVIAENNKKIAELQKEQADAMSLMLKTMKANKLKEWEIPDARAEIVVPQGRATNLIDPSKYQKLVTKDDFMESIKVSVEQAKKFLGMKELEKITTVTPGKPGEPRLDIEYR